jgi:L-alanine-DL-glutamate epimerase-like enolase superfamily enzyme
MGADGYTIIKVEVWPIDLPLIDPFVVATGSRVTAHNAYARITLAGGAVGYGEMAPFPEVGGEDRAACLETAARLAAMALGRAVTEWQAIGRLFFEAEAAHPAARCGLETAMVDALCRQVGIPLWAYWGAADVRERGTDITIPICDIDRTVALGEEWYRRGFRLIKTKVGTDVDQDVRRMEALHVKLPGLIFIPDANQGFTRDECRHFVKEVQRCGASIMLLEQPLAKDDLDGMAALRRDLGIPIAADESIRTVQDVREVIRREAADFVNIKITKSGLLVAMDIMGCARAAGLRLMIGGMVETRIAMACSFGLVLGTGGFDVLDLDTPLLLAHDPVMGGYRYSGPTLQPWSGAGLDLSADIPPTAMVFE